jgi:Holliday junction resolvase RusA-like endonuclease
MKNRIEFSVYGKPYGQKRPRAYRKGRLLGIYSPKENVEYAQNVKESLLKVVKPKGLIYDNVPLVVEIQAFFNYPKLTKKQKALNLLRDKFPVKKPDGDNIAKAILDGLTSTEVVWTDDSYVVSLCVDKFYTTEKERVTVVIYEKE